MKKDEIKPLPPVTKAQNVTAAIVAIFFVAFVVIGGWYLKTHQGETGAGGPTSGTSGGYASSGLPSQTVNGVKFDFKGQFRMPQSEIQIETRDAQRKLIDIGSLKLSFVMNMPGMVMHDEANVTGSGGHYKATIKHGMAGDWNAQLSFNGPNGPGQTSFRVSVKG